MTWTRPMVKSNAHDVMEVLGEGLPVSALAVQDREVELIGPLPERRR